MRITYIPVSQKDWLHIIHDQHGAGFLGYPYQRGAGLGSIFRRIFRAIMPYAKSAGKSLLSTGADIASDVVSGENLETAVKKNARKTAGNLLEAAAKKMRGGKLGKRRAINTKKKRKSASRKKPQLGMII